jgi:hypothetical protein
MMTPSPMRLPPSILLPSPTVTSLPMMEDEMVQPGWTVVEGKMKEEEMSQDEILQEVEM